MIFPSNDYPKQKRTQTTIRSATCQSTDHTFPYIFSGQVTLQNAFLICFDLRPVHHVGFLPLNEIPHTFPRESIEALTCIVTIIPITDWYLFIFTYVNYSIYMLQVLNFVGIDNWMIPRNLQIS